MEQNEPSSSADSSQAPQSFLRRHRVAIIIVLGILVFILGLVRFVHFRQKQHQEEAQIARAGRFRPPPGEQR
ncbi:MAG TPA: hypothetical protein VI653_08935, partial [Steroidobacteraceae bacterium]